MMPSNITIAKIVLSLLFLAFFSRVQAEADEVRFSNGDLITGEITGMEEGTLHVKTSHSGSLQVSWKELNCLSSKKNFEFLMKDGRKFVGGIECPEKGKARIKNARKEHSTVKPLQSVISIKSYPQPSFTMKGVITSGGSRAQGNTDTMILNSSADFEARMKKKRVTLETNFNYGETESEVTTRNYLGNLKYDYFFVKKLYGYLNTMLERDDFQDLDLRSIFGGGMGVQFIDNKMESLFVEAGPSYFKENYKSSKDEAYIVGRWSLKYNMNLLKDRLKLFHFHEGFYRVKGGGHYYVRSEQGCRVSLIKNIYANFQMDYKYDNQPATGKKHYDTVYIVGLGYEFN